MYKQVIIIRKDLPMTKGQMAAQIAHASVGAVVNNIEHSDVKEWLKTSFIKIILEVDNCVQLKNISFLAKKNKLIVCDIIESFIPNYIQEIKGKGTLTAIAIGPHHVDKINNITRKVSLYK